MSPLDMNWKSTATVSGATLLAGWLGWSPPPPAATSAPAATSRGAEASDIQAQAERLQLRVRTELEYRDPTRNPFRFGAGPTASARPQSPAPLDIPVAIGAPFTPLMPFTLSGMATENVDGAARRTAILTAGSEVLFVQE